MASIQQHDVQGGTLTVTTPGDPASDPVGKAASAFNVPLDILWGVYGLETDFGANVATSSAGAQGAFQFLPSTAHRYAYPLTNAPNAQQFAQQATGAAHYLSDLYRQALAKGLTGDAAWDDALHHYSGGGYGLSQVKAKAKGKDAPNETQSPALSIPNPLNVASDFYKLVTSPQTWLRLVEIVGGVVLLAMGLKALTGGAIDPMAPARAAARVVP
jgi:hypothetical protein